MLMLHHYGSILVLVVTRSREWILLGMYCAKQKGAEYATEEEATALRRAGVQVPLKQHVCIYQGTKGCFVCKDFHAGFQ